MGLGKMGMDIGPSSPSSFPKSFPIPPHFPILGKWGWVSFGGRSTSPWQISQSPSTLIIPASLNPHIIVHHDNSTFPTIIALNETNYSLWSQLMEIRIGARNKVGYLTIATVKPAYGDANYDTWITENHKVKSWLIDSMTLSFMQRFIHFTVANEVWDAVSKTFYDGSDETHFLELNKKSFSTKQNSHHLPTYYNELVAIFQEIDHRTTSQAGIVEGVVQLHFTMTRLHVHIFLSGLDLKYIRTMVKFYKKIQDLIWRVVMRMTEESTGKNRHWEALI
ncbi:hypothetical protein Ddye_000685 [Dipteronia dyeriana]|uniref:Retrotransposon Copia-like N-terminal domain-containing protein n=1 Tax=Dipteronia dyeriana TaxID=168575 RepID=A0AAE0CSS8_9ROSI|nr:hypothetical protein Ddye_000685 [Dipteronia dyeriana]